MKVRFGGVGGGLARGLRCCPSLGPKRGDWGPRSLHPAAAHPPVLGLLREHPAGPEPSPSPSPERAGGGPPAAARTPRCRPHLAPAVPTGAPRVLLPRLQLHRERLLGGDRRLRGGRAPAHPEGRGQPRDVRNRRGVAAAADAPAHPASAAARRGSHQRHQRGGGSRRRHGPVPVTFARSGSAPGPAGRAGPAGLGGSAAARCRNVPPRTAPCSILPRPQPAVPGADARPLAPPRSSQGLSAQSPPPQLAPLRVWGGSP